MKKPLIENLELTDVKRNDSGLKVEFVHNHMEGEMHYRDVLQKESSVPIGENLNNCLNSMRPYVLQILRHIQLCDVVESNEFSASDKQKEHIKKALSDLELNIKINGVKISGTNEDQRVIIKSVFQIANTNQVTAINSPLLHLKNESFGFEEDLKQALVEIKEECYTYFYEPESVQRQLFEGDPAD